MLKPLLDEIYRAPGYRHVAHVWNSRWLSMSVELGNISLTHLTHVDVNERGRFVYHQVPGMSGDLTQKHGQKFRRHQFTGRFPTAAALLMIWPSYVVFTWNISHWIFLLRWWAKAISPKW